MDTFLKIFIVGVVITIGFGMYHTNETDTRKKQDCYITNGYYDIYTRECKTKYEYCLEKVRLIFSDINDTWGSSQNHQDTISKTMSEEITRCISIKQKYEMLY